MRVCSSLQAEMWDMQEKIMKKLERVHTTSQEIAISFFFFKEFHLKVKIRNMTTMGFDPRNEGAQTQSRRKWSMAAEMLIRHSTMCVW